MILKVNCQHCNHPVEVDAAERSFFCPSCHQETFIEGQVQPPSKGVAAFNADTLKKRVKSIRREAAVFIFLAVALFLIGILIVGASFCGAFGSNGFDGLIFGCGFISVAVWLYLIAQIVYIRANTER